MIPHKPGVRLPWRRMESIGEIARRLRKRESVVLRLPASFHHARCVGLCTDGRQIGAIEKTGGTALLRKVADIEGLGELAELCALVTQTGAAVRVRSHSPQLIFTPPAAKSRNTKRMHRFDAKSVPHFH